MEMSRLVLFVLNVMRAGALLGCTPHALNPMELAMKFSNKDTQMPHEFSIRIRVELHTDRLFHNMLMLKR